MYGKVLKGEIGPRLPYQPYTHKAAVTKDDEYAASRAPEPNARHGAARIRLSPPSPLVSFTAELVTERPPEILLQAQLIRASGRVHDGQLITAVAIPWRRILREIEKDKNFLAHFAAHPRSFEEFIAAAYDQTGEWDEVILTPRSGDGGRDVIVVKHGFGSIRFLEQTKAYSPGRLVTHDDLRAMLGVLQTDPNSSKGIITTTSDFAPGVLSGPEFARFMPHRLETKNGKQLSEWLQSIAGDDAR